MIRFLTLFCIIAALMLSPTHAQDSLPPPLNADEVFTDAVEVVETLPLLNVEEEYFSLYDDATASWQRYIFPYGNGYNSFFTLLEDGTYLIQFVDIHGYGGSFVNGRLYFDPQTGEFTQPNAICGDLAQVIEPDRGRWILLQDNASDTMYFCNSGTGEATPTLPMPEWTEIFAFSPDGDWILLYTEQTYGLAAYQLSTNTLNYLGEVELFVLNTDIWWINDTRFVMHYVNYSAGVLVGADMSSSDSLQTIARAFGMIFVSEPAHYEWHGSEIPLGKRLVETDPDCRSYELSLTTGRLREYDVAGICELGALIPDGSGDRLAFDDESGMALRFNRYTGDVQTLFASPRGENILFSPDGRYFAMDMNRTQTNHELGDIIVVDMQTGEQVYNNERLSNYDRAQWVDNEHLLLYEDQPEVDRLINATTGAETLLTIVHAANNSVSPDARYILVQPDADTLAVYDVLTSETIVLAQHITDFRDRLTWEQDGSLHVQFSTDDGIHIGDWRVRIVP